MSSQGDFESLPLRSQKKSLLHVEEQALGKRGFFDGMQTFFFFSKEATASLAAPFVHSLIDKFSHGRPTVKVLTKHLFELKLKGNVSLKTLSGKHVLIEISNEEDYTRIWMRQQWWFDGYPMRVFKWTPTFNPREESPVFPVWIRLPGLPVHLFDKRAMAELAKFVGVPLKIDEPTADRSRVTIAIICVEVDLTKPRVNEFGM